MKNTLKINHENHTIMMDRTFAEKADAKVRNVKNSKHEIFMSGDDVLSWYFGEILDFFG